MKPRTRLVWLASWLVLSLACSRDLEAEPAARPNVVLIVVDTLRSDHLSLYGYSRPTSPNLEQLAEQSVVFDNAVTVMSHTLPATLSLMTGVHPETHRVLSNGARYAGPYATFAERLALSGYATAGFVSGSPLLATSGMARGFDLYRDTRTRDRRSVAPSLAGERTNRRVHRWLAETREEPFFLFVHYFDTHRPYSSAPAGSARLAPDPQLTRWIAERGIEGLSAREVTFKPIHLDGSPVELAEAINAYDNQILRVDSLIADLLATLERAGQLEDSLVVIAADHGEGLGEHGYYSHGLHLYEEQLRVLLLIRPPAALAAQPEWQPRRVTSLVSLLDVLPTVLDIVGLPGDESLQGRSLKTAKPEARALLASRRSFPANVRARRGDRFSAATPLHALRGERFKYLRSGSGDEELYDLRADPGERHDLATENPALTTRMAGDLEALLQLRSSDRPAAALEVDAAEREALEALGYLQ